MNSRSLIILAAITLCVVIAAFVVMRPTSYENLTGPEGKLFPELTSQVNDVATVQISTGDAMVELKKQAGGWVVSSQDGYPARYEPIKELVLAMADLEIVEQKTDDPDMYERLGVQEPAPGESPVLVTLLDDRGTSLASLIVGNMSQGGAAADGGRFVRKPQEQRSWLVSGRINLRATHSAWMSRELLRLDQDLIEQVMIAPESGPATVIVRSESDSSAFVIRDMPEGRELKNLGELGRIISTLAYLDFDTVRAARDSADDQDDLVLTSVRLDNGAAITMRSWSEDSGIWWSISAAFTPSEGPIEPESEQAALEAEGRELVESINSTHSAWDYQLAPARAAMIRSTVEDLTKATEGEASSD